MDVKMVFLCFVLSVHPVQGMDTAGIGTVDKGSVSGTAIKENPCLYGIFTKLVGDESAADGVLKKLKDDEQKDLFLLLDWLNDVINYERADCIRLLGYVCEKRPIASLELLIRCGVSIDLSSHGCDKALLDFAQLNSDHRVEYRLKQIMHDGQVCNPVRTTRFNEKMVPVNVGDCDDKDALDCASAKEIRNSVDHDHGNSANSPVAPCWTVDKFGNNPLHRAV